MITPKTSEGISVFFPAFNDAGSIQRLVKDALAVLNTLTDDFEVLVINDGSTDETALVLEELVRTQSRVKIVDHKRNLGYGAALRSGFSNAKKDLVFYTDGDGQYDVSQLADLRPLLIDGVDVVNGFKIKRADKNARKVAGAVYNRFARLLFRLPIRDVDCDFRLLRRSVLQNVELTSSSGAICIELVYKLRLAGAVFAETPVCHYPRAYGRSQFFTLHRVSRTLQDFFFLWWRLVGLRHLLNVRDGIRRMNARNEVAR